MWCYKTSFVPSWNFSRHFVANFNGKFFQLDGETYTIRFFSSFFQLIYSNLQIEPNNSLGKNVPKNDTRKKLPAICLLSYILYFIDYWTSPNCLGWFWGFSLYTVQVKYTNRCKVKHTQKNYSNINNSMCTEFTFISLICIGFSPFRKTHANLRMQKAKEDRRKREEESKKGREVFGFCIILMLIHSSRNEY